jgi:arsenate reductase (glutaredoxin)
MATMDNPDVALYHNPRCTKSRQALQIAEQAGDRFAVEVVRYLETPPSADELRAILAKLEDEPSRLVRRERWDELGVTADDVASPEGVVAVLTAHPQLMERPLIVTADRAFIGRPTERVSDFFGTD